MKKICHCGKPSIPGLISSVSLCQYHYNVRVFGKEWADKCEQQKYCKTVQRSERSGGDK